MRSRILIRISTVATMFSTGGFFGASAYPGQNAADGMPMTSSGCADPSSVLPGELSPRSGILPQENSWYSRALDFFCAPTQDGIIMTGILVLAALVSSSYSLFIELDLIPTVLVSLAALITLAASGIVLKARYERRSWFVFGRPAGLGAGTGTAPAPADPGPVSPEPSPARLQAGSRPGERGEDRPRPEFDEPSSAELEWYWVDEPFSYVKIQRVGTEGFVYVVYEPPVSGIEKTVLQETYARLRDIIVYNASETDTKDQFTTSVIHDIIREFDPAISKERLDILTYYLRRDLSGYGPLEVLMRDPALEDLSCNGWDLPVFIFHKVYGSLPTSVVFHEGELNQFVLKLAQKANKQLSLSNPLLDATLPDGARVQITYSDVVSTKGSSFTIRKFRADPMTPLDLIRLGTYSPRTLALIWLAIEHHKSLLVVGGTASGKTSTMNGVSLFIPQNAKIVSLEDTREIQLPHKNWLPTQTRELHAESLKGDIDLFSLLKACMRQRPEYIIVGEVRGREAQTLFQAMNTGHATLSTIHAGTVQEAINRLTHDPINVPPVMFQALDLVVVQSIYTLGKRRIRRNMSIHEIEVNGRGEVQAVPLFEWDIHSDTFRQVSDRSRVLDEIAAHCGWNRNDLDRELKKREEFFEWALTVRNPTIHDLANAIHDLGE